MPDTWTEQRLKLEPLAKAGGVLIGDAIRAALARIDRLERALEAADDSLKRIMFVDGWHVNGIAAAALSAIREARTP